MILLMQMSMLSLLLMLMDEEKRPWKNNGAWMLTGFVWADTGGPNDHIG